VRRFDEFSPTFRLFSVPSFLEGMAMAVDYSHTMPEFNLSGDPALDDCLALLADWRAVAGDLDRALGAFVDA
jgi:hypothetical protein